jgi:hypothetical protein
MERERFFSSKRKVIIGVMGFALGSGAPDFSKAKAQGGYNAMMDRLRGAYETGIVNLQNGKPLNYREQTPDVTVPNVNIPGEFPVRKEFSEEERVSVINYIKEIFGKDWKTAYGIAMAESNFIPDKPNITSKETSIGIFQINLQSDAGKVHFDKVPGNTLEEKIENLKNPYINTLVAYRIYKENGFEPWTTFVDKKYEEYLKEMKD